VDLPRFDRRFFDSGESLSVIGSGALGGKAQGLLSARDFLAARIDPRAFARMRVEIPTMAVIATDAFDAFLERNRLRDLGASGEPDHRLAHAFQRAELPAELVGDLWGLIRQVHTPLAIRSSSLLEDALKHPFAGVYATKMIPNNQFEQETRFRKLVEAIKLVYASTFFESARAYIEATGRAAHEEKMAVIVQEVVGSRHGPRFYPDVAGVARSYNFYPSGHARPEQGVASLALGLGKTIVDGGLAWTYSPAYPHVAPPYASLVELLEHTQTEFWAVNMGTPPAYDPIAETEYLVRGSLAEAEADETLRHVASTYDPRSDRIAIGTSAAGPRLLNFAPLLVHDEFPLNALLKALLAASEEATQGKVEIEFALAFPPEPEAARFGFLQVRPMAVSSQPVEIAPEELADGAALVVSLCAMGNGVVADVRDVVFVKPEAFDAKWTREIASEIEAINRKLASAHVPYLLIGFGRWGSSDPWLGIPVSWPQISGARVIVEATLPNMNVDMSQGAHFFHNLISFEVPYLSVPRQAQRGIHWRGLAELEAVEETRFVRHARSVEPLLVKVDGRSGRGVVLRAGGP